MTHFDKYTSHKTILSVNALIFCEGQVLLLKRAKDKKVDPGFYAGIGGKVEPGESFYDALFREIEEETGITKIDSFRLYSVTQHPYPPTDSEWVNLYFVVNISKKINIPKSSEGEFFWKDPSKIESLPMATDMKEYLKILTQNPKAFIFGYFDHDETGKLTNKTIKVMRQ